MNKSTILGILVIIFISIFLSMYTQLNELKEELAISESNNKAYQMERVALEGQSNMYKLTIDQLEYFNDSIINKLKEVKEQLKIKDKNIKQLQYVESNTSKLDTIVLRDTIFRDNVSIDTTIGDNWFKVNLELKYPDSLIVNPSFKNEAMILISSKKETIKPPKKWWWQRLFQKKHTVIQVDVIENNPYTEVQEQRFIEVIK